MFYSVRPDGEIGLSYMSYIGLDVKNAADLQRNWTINTTVRRGEGAIKKYLQRPSNVGYN